MSKFAFILILAAITFVSCKHLRKVEEKKVIQGGPHHIKVDTGATNHHHKGHHNHEKGKGKGKGKGVKSLGSSQKVLSGFLEMMPQGTEDYTLSLQDACKQQAWEDATKNIKFAYNSGLVGSGVLEFFQPPPMNSYEEVQEEDNNIVIESSAVPVDENVQEKPQEDDIIDDRAFPVDQNLSLIQQEVQSDPIVDQDLGEQKEDAFEKLDSDINAIEKDDQQQREQQEQQQEQEQQQ